MVRVEERVLMFDEGRRGCSSTRGNSSMNASESGHKTLVLCEIDGRAMEDS